LQAYESGASSPEENDGYMHKDESATHLANKMTVKLGSGSAVAIGASSAAPEIFASTQSTGANKVITFGQQVTSADTAGAYEITVTFSAVASS